MPPADVGSGPRYRTREIAGRDRLGTLWTGTDVRTGTPVTVRVLGEALTSDRERVRRAEARLRRLRGAVADPHLARVADHDLQPVADRPAFVVYEAAGETLATMLDRRGAFATSAALAVVADVADGLAAAHAAWIHHGALTASSVLLGADGEAVVIDVGLGELLDGPDAPGAATPGNLTDRSAADVFAVAVLFEQLLAGSAEPPTLPEGDAPRRWEPVVPAEAGAVLRGALSPHRLLRPEMAELAEVLAKVRTVDRADARAAVRPTPPVASPIPAAPTTSPVARSPSPARPDPARPASPTLPAAPPERAARGGRHRVRRRALVAMVVGALLVAVAAGGFVALRWVRGTDRERPVAATRSHSPSPSSTPSTSATPAIAGATVPDILGRRMGPATDLLERAGLVVGAVTEVPGDRGRVVRTDPTPGEAVVAGTVVAIFVGDGSEG